MTTLTDQLKKALAFKNCDGNSPETERGRQIAHSSLAPIHEALISVVGALVRTMDAEYERNAKEVIRHAGRDGLKSYPLDGNVKADTAYFCGYSALAKLTAALEGK